MAGSDQSSEAGQKFVGFVVCEEIGLFIGPEWCPQGCIRVWDEIEVPE